MKFVALYGRNDKRSNGNFIQYGIKLKSINTETCLSFIRVF